MSECTFKHTAFWMCELVSDTASMKVCRDNPTIKYSALYTGLLDIWTELIQRKYCIRKYWEFEGLGFNPNSILGMPQIPTLRISRTLTCEQWSSMIILVGRHIIESCSKIVLWWNVAIMTMRNTWKYGHSMWKYVKIRGNTWNYSFASLETWTWSGIFHCQTRLPQAICSGQGGHPVASTCWFIRHDGNRLQIVCSGLVKGAHWTRIGLGLD